MRASVKQILPSQKVTGGSLCHLTALWAASVSLECCSGDLLLTKRNVNGCDITVIGEHPSQ